MVNTELERGPPSIDFPSFKKGASPPEVEERVQRKKEGNSVRTTTSIVRSKRRGRWSRFFCANDRSRFRERALEGCGSGKEGKVSRIASVDQRKWYVLAINQRRHFSASSSIGGFCFLSPRNTQLSRVFLPIVFHERTCEIIPMEEELED